MRYFTSGMSPLLRKQELNELQSLETQWNWFRGATGTDPTNRQWPTLILENDLGADIEPGQHVGIKVHDEWDLTWTNLDFIPKAQVPDPDLAVAIALDFVEPGKSGSFIAMGITVAEVQAGSGEFGEVDSSRILKPTETPTNVLLLGQPKAGEQTLQPVLIGAGGGSSAIQIKTPPGGIPAKTGTGEAGNAYVYGSATCDLIDPLTGLRFSPNRTETIYNQVNVALGGSLQYGCVKRSGRWFVDVGDCQAPASPPVVEV